MPNVKQSFHRSWSWWLSVVACYTQVFGSDSLPYPALLVLHGLAPLKAGMRRWLSAASEGDKIQLAWDKRPRTWAQHWRTDSETVQALYSMGHKDRSNLHRWVWEGIGQVQLCYILVPSFDSAWWYGDGGWGWGWWWVGTWRGAGGYDGSFRSSID